MKFPKRINTYCPKCRKKTIHAVKLASKGKSRTLAWGNLRHQRKLKGYGGKVAGEKTVRKQGKRQKIVLQCGVCKKKHERVVGTRTRKRLEIKA